MLIKDMRPYRVLVVLASVLVGLATSSAARAIECGEKHTVKENETLNDIARQAYGLPNKWTLIYYANQRQFGNSPVLVPGKQLKIPCLKSTPSVPAAGGQAGGGAKSSRPAKIAVSRIKGDIQMLTAGDYRPFTDQSLIRGGMITDLVTSALTRLKEDSDGPGHTISWVNDWSSHLNPLLVRKAFDMGFPWFQPACDKRDQLDEPARFRCDKFFFSQPVFEILVLFFTNKSSDFQFTSDEQIVGKRLCRPSGYFTFDLDEQNRNWVKDEKITLIRPQNVDECFQLLMKGEVDAVALNEFTGRAAVRKLGIEKDINVNER
ncbi:MAG: transporter substrate-binding domain-containing protein, partial [Hyphomicrobiales bacterium]|nr:transporter substrate-binding domain-containing protein [Hyphomicrobiales bacterium]